MTDTPRLLDVQRWGRTTYAEAHRRQLELLEARVAGEIGDTLVLTEHESVVTYGRKSGPEDLGALDVPVVEVERGGEATYHGPGQLVAYPIILLPEGRRDLHRFLRELEEAVIGVLAEFGVEGRREPGLTGVWIGDRKICSLGVAVRRWVTWHGLALNVHTDLAAFQGFAPCGLAPDVMTRLADHADLPPGQLLVEVLLVKHLTRVLGLELPEPPPLADPGPSDCGFPQLPILPG